MGFNIGSTGTAGIAEPGVVPAGAAPGVHPRRIVLLGNPNVGKSALFNALTGLRATVSNYPGTTVEVYRGRLSGGTAEVIDSPGLNSLVPLSEDERVTSELVRSVRGEAGAVVVQVADAKNLRRALLLTLQLGQLEVPTVLVLNMHDEAEARGIKLDLAGLEAALGIPVRTTVATRHLGIEGVTCALAAARAPRNHMPIPEEVGAGAFALLSGAEAPPEHPPAFLSRYHEALLGHADAITKRYATDGNTVGKAFSRRSGASRSTRSGAGRSCWPCSTASTSSWASSAPGRRGLDGKRAVSRLPESLGRDAVLLPAVRPGARLVRGGVRPHHDGAVVRPRDRAADHRHLLHLPSRCSRTRATCHGSR